MSLKSNLQTFITNAGSAFKNVRSSITGNGTDDASAVAAALDTASGNIVGAINEVHSEVDAISASSVASVNGQTPVNGAVTVSTTNIAEGDNLYFTDFRADNRVQSAIGDTASPSASEIASTQHVVDYGQSIKTEILGGATAAYDTLQELESEITGNNTDISGILTAVGNRLRFDGAQTLTAAQKNYVFTNLNLGVDIDTHDFAADWDAAIS